MFRLVCSHRQAELQKQKKIVLQPGDGWILAETCSWFPFRNKLSFLDWIFFSSGDTENTTGMNHLTSAKCIFCFKVHQKRSGFCFRGICKGFEKEVTVTSEALVRWSSYPETLSGCECYWHCVSRNPGVRWANFRCSANTQFFYTEISEHNLIDSTCISGFSPILRAWSFLLYLQCKLVIMKFGFHKHGWILYLVKYIFMCHEFIVYVASK